MGQIDLRKVNPAAAVTLLSETLSPGFSKNVLKAVLVLTNE
jgi:hypothetical protein